MIINGIELQDIDIFDVQIAEKYEKAMLKIANIENDAEGLSLTDSIRKHCNTIFDVFNDLFGEGADRKVFGDKVNLMTCIKAFEELVLELNKQKEQLEIMQNKYSPNRATRRSK